MPWLAYDVHFRKQAAARKATNIAETDTSIWTWYFGRVKPRMVCRDCFEPGHVSCVDGEEEPCKAAAVKTEACYACCWCWHTTLQFSLFFGAS